MKPEELSHLIIRRKQWALKKRLILEALERIRCPYATLDTTSISLELDAVSDRIFDLKMWVMEGEK